MTRKLLLALIAISLATSASAADLVRIVRFKLSAGDIVSGIAAVDDYKKATGVDAEYLDAVGWLARGAEMLRRPDLAQKYVTEIRQQIPAETPELVVPLGAAIEVEGKLIAAREGRGAAIRFLEEELSHAKAVPLRSRIQKNINIYSLEGQKAPEFEGSDYVSGQPTSIASLKGKPVLMYFWAWGCGDCKAQSATVARIGQKYRSQGLAMMTATRLYGTIQEKPATPDEEKAQILKIWNEQYAGLDGVPVLVSTETMIHYGVSATPTFALVDKKGIVRLYTPTRLSEAELSRRIEELLAE